MAKKTANKRAPRKPRPQKPGAQEKRIPGSHKTQREAQARQKVAERRVRVAALYHAGLTQEEIADREGVDQSQISRDLALLREQWRVQAVDTIGLWVERELAYALAQRAATLEAWEKERDSKLMSVVVRWTERIAKLLGLDAPDKLEDWTDRDWREYAAANNLTEEEVLAEAEAILAEAQRGAPADPTNPAASR